MIFKNDLFISYANSDDEEDTRGERWVMRFQRDLSVALATRLGERPEVFSASEMWRASDRLSFVLQNARQSAVFLAILSPRYIASRGFEPRELVWFGSQSSAANIVAVELLPVQEESVLPLLRECKRTRFWSGLSERHVLPLTPRSNPELYYERLQSLAYGINQLLSTVEGQAEMRQRAAHHRRTPWDVFVSHVGEDHKFAGEVETRIKKELGKTAREVNVFNTSDSESRFYQIFGPDQRHLLPEYEGELKEYIEHNMSMSRVYLLLVSRRSLEKNSKWVSYEISIAREFAAGRPWFFIPCVFDGVKLSELPVEAANFHGIDISSEMGFGELFRHLREALKGPV